MIIDAILVLVIAWGFYTGFSRGIIKTIFTVFSIAFGVVAAFKFAPTLANLLKSFLNGSNELMYFIGLGSAFLLTMFIIRMFAKGFENILQAANLNFINQTIGGAVVAGFYVVLYSLLIWFADASTILKEETKAQSATYPILKEIPAKSRIVMDEVKPIMMNSWKKSVQLLDELEKVTEKSESDPKIFDIEE